MHFGMHGGFDEDGRPTDVPRLGALSSISVRTLAQLELDLSYSMQWAFSDKAAPWAQLPLPFFDLLTKVLGQRDIHRMRHTCSGWYR